MKQFLALAVFAAILASCSSPGYEISGTIESLPEGKVLLEQLVDGEYIANDTSVVTNGEFSFSGRVEHPDIYFLRVPGRRGRAVLFLENSDITIRGHADTIPRASIEGSFLQDEFKSFTGKQAEIMQNVNEIYNKYREALVNNDEVLANSLAVEVDDAYQKIDAFSRDFIAENPASVVSSLILRDIAYGMEAEELQSYLDMLDPSLENAVFVKELNGRIKKLLTVAVGEIAPDFSQNDPEGNPVKLSDFRGKYLLVDFWAAWCGPCRMENPNVVAAYDKFHEQGFDVLGVSLDQSREDWLKAIEDDGLTWTHVSDLQYWNNGAAKLYGINSIPSNLLLDPEGKIIYKGLRGPDLHTTLEELLTE